MKKLILLALLIIATISAQSQITLTATAGTTSGSFTTLKGAFDAINAGTHQGAIVISVNASTTESASAVLNASATGSANYTGVTIYPTVSGLSISGSITGSPLVSLNGSDNVVIDGRVNQTGIADLTISNTSTSSAADLTCTIRFTNDALNNTLKYCYIKGSSLSTTTKGAIIYFDSPGSVGGNAGNLIDNNYITSTTDANRPMNGIYAAGANSSSINKNITISNNRIYNVLNRGIASNAIYLANFNADWTISGNSIYETVSIVPTAAVAYTLINISTSTGNHHTIQGNYLGGTAENCGGTAFTKTGAFENAFKAIYVSVPTGGTASSIQGNFIQNFDYTNGGSVYTNWTAIEVAGAGDYNVGTVTGNTIGAATGNDNIKYNAAITFSFFYGVYISGTGTVDCEKNTFGSITTTSTDPTYGVSIYVIFKGTISGFTPNSTAGNTTISNNIIGSSTTTKSIQSIKANGSQDIYGIYSNGLSNISVIGNTVCNMFSAGLAGHYNAGILCDNGVTSTGNTIVSNNFIHDLVNPLGFVWGLGIATSSSNTNANTKTISNNIISLGTGDQNNTSIRGIFDQAAQVNANHYYYFNTVYVTGAPSTGSSYTAALWVDQATGNRTFKNNIFQNTRSNTGTSNGPHYAIYFNYAGSANLTLANNDYHVSGIGSVLGYYSSTPVFTLPIVVGRDAGSSNLNPSFANPGGATASSYIPSNTFLMGATGTGITTDYANTTRSATTPSMGAYELVVLPNISVTATSGTASAGYSNLKDVFDAINAGTHKGDVEVKVNVSIIETANPILNASGTGSSSYTSIKIYPTASGVTISASLATTLINLNGADNVTIDGRVNQTGSTADMTISNAGTSNVSTILFVGDASNNTVKYCNILGSNTSSSYGTIYFSTGTTTGNDGNTIANNNISSIGASLPANAIYSAGTSTGVDNSGITISNNNIQDYAYASSATNGILIASNSSAWTITGNRFFQTAARTFIASHHAINIITSSGGGYTINNNIIGYSSVSGTGTSSFTFTGTTPVLIPIELTAATSPVSEIQGNTITAISMATASTVSSGAGIFSGISILAGTVNVGTSSANTIGAETGTGSINITPSTGTPTVNAIYATSTGTIAIQNNKIGGISINGAATIGFIFYGINTAGTAGNFTISNNFIGSSVTSNSITVGTNGTTTSGFCTFYGINQIATGTVSITGNTIQNCSAYGTSASIFWGVYNSGSTGTTAINSNTILNGNLQGNGNITGIYNNAVPTVLNCNSNTISGLTAASTSTAIGIHSAGAATTINMNSNTINGIASSGASCNISGINSTAGATVNIVTNNIYNLSGSGTSPLISGIILAGGTNVYAYNNFISELKAPAGNLDDVIRGISVTSSTASSVYGVYYNTIYLNASSSGTNFGSTGIYHAANSTATSASLDLRNNIIANNSAANGTGKTVAFRRSSGALNYLLNYGSASNNNNFYAGSPSSSNLIYYDGTSSASTLFSYKTGVFTAGTVANRDNNSITELPTFINTATSPYDLRIDPTVRSRCESNGVVVSTPISITTDYYGTARYPNAGYPVNGSFPPSLPDIGAQEFSGKPALGLSGTVNVGVGQTYTSLTNVGGLFEAIYNNGLSGNLTALINSDLSAETGSIELMQWAGTNTLTISPTGGSSRTISGNVNTTLISLNGADNVTIDGLNSGGNSLTINNSNTGTSASTIKFSNDATSNAIKNSTVLGSSLNSAGGVIFFSTTTGSTGNDGNLIDNNNITNSADANRPLNAIYSLGTVSKTNSGNTISNNNIYNFLNRGTASNGIQIAGYNTGWTISANSFYETASFIPTASVTYNSINISATTSADISITGNYIGGSSPNCGTAGSVTSWTKTNAFTNIFNGININVGPTVTTTSSIQGNTIKNFTWSDAGASSWTGINIPNTNTGALNIGTSTGNIIGTTNGTGGIIVTAGAASSLLYGIYSAGTGLNSISSNTIANLNNASASSGTLSGLYYNGSTTASTVSNNFINNLAATGTGSTVTIYGIQIAAGATTYSNNIISLGGNTATTLYGIYETGTANNNNNLYYNTINISGSLATGVTNQSYALYSNVTTNARNFRNNIFSNTRSTISGSSKHFAIYFNTAGGTLNCDYNDYYATGTGSVLGYYAAYKTVLPIVTGVTGNDGFSLANNPVFVNATGNIASNYKPTNTFLQAVIGTSITSDFEGTLRSSSTPSIGAYEVAVSGVVTVTASAGTQLTGTYSNLKSAFDAINSGTHQGVIEIKINNNTFEPYTAALNASGTGSALYTSVKLYPTISGLSISGSLANALIDLNGADNVTIDGRVNQTGSTIDLTISNLLTTNATTLRFLADATGNTVKYCNIQGSNTTFNFGTIFFSTGTTIGNDGNTITNNNINAAGVNLPINAIYSAGTSTSIDNSNNIISNNNIFDHSGSSSSGINVASNSSGWTITGNKFYQTASRAISGTHRAINIITSSGGGYAINNNQIGYSSNNSTGVSTFTGSGNFTPIELTVATSPVSEIQGNTITAISLSTSSAAAIFSGISILGGSVNIGTTTQNIIGSETGVGAITILPTVGTPIIQGIVSTSTGTVSIQNNKIGGISMNGAATIGYTFNGIITSGTAGIYTISNNSIGSATTGNSISVGSNGVTTSGICTFYGIKQSASGAANISGNTIQNCSAYGTGASVFYGIFSSGTGTATIATNIVTNALLQGTGTFTGITISAGSIVHVSRNKISILTQNGAFVSSGTLSGILMSAGTTVYAYNNMISELKASNANIDDAIRGISVTSSTPSATYGVYNNTVYLNANSSGTNFGTTGLYHVINTTATTGALDLRNNIIANNSVASGTGRIIAFRRSAGASSNLANYANTSNYNNFYVGTNGANYQIYYDGSNTLQSIYGYKNGIISAGTIAPRDAASINELPPFVNITTSPYDLRISTSIASLCESKGSVITTPSVNVDIDNNPRYSNSGYPANASNMPTAPDIGAHEFAGISVAGLSGTVNVGAGQTYTSLTNAGGLFEAIYNNGLSGNLTALITSDLTAETGEVELTQWTSTYSLTISPTGGAARIVSGNVNKPLISLNGPDKVTFDGLNTDGNKLSITNLSTLSIAGTSTIRFINGATGNTIKNCTIKGSTTDGSGAVIFLSTSSTPTGNSNNIIDHNEITKEGSNYPKTLISSTSTTGKENIVTVTNNNFSDFSNFGINATAGNTSWVIANNNFFLSTSFSAATIDHEVIRATSGSGYTINNNNIGGSAANCTGTWVSTTAGASYFYGIYLAHTVTDVASKIYNNRISNISLTGYCNSGYFTGIYLGNGTINAGTDGANTIGSGTGNSNIVLTSTYSGSIATSNGILVSNSITGPKNISNNIIGSIDASNTQATLNSGHTFIAITSAGVGALNIINNVIGSTTTANSINATNNQSVGNSTSGQDVKGIYCTNNSNTTLIKGNTIANLTNSWQDANTTRGLLRGIEATSLTGSISITENNIYNLTSAQPMTGALPYYANNIGIALTSNSATTSLNISKNTVHDLVNTSNTFAGSITGILYSGPSAVTGTIDKNFIYNLFATGASSSAGTLYGLYINGGPSTSTNNIVTIGANSNTTLYGIWEPGTSGSNASIYYNTVNIKGSLLTGSTNKSYAFWSNGNASVRNFRNNIFSNTRSTVSGSNLHYAVGYYYSAVPVTLTSDYNDYYSSGTGSALGVYYTTTKATLTNWQSATSQDVKSQNFDPKFTNGSGTSELDYFPATALPGIIISSITGDYYGNTRVSPVMGALEQNQIPVPTITSFTPVSAGAGTTVTITGTNLTGATAVSFGATAANSYNVVSPTSITAVIGSGTTGDVKVVTPIGTVTKNGFTWLSSNADLSDLTLATGTLNVLFASNVTSYTVSLASSVASFSLIPTAAESHATINVNGTAIASAVSTQSIPLAYGTNTISVVVTAQDAVTSKTYTITVTRAAAAPVLSSVSVSSISYATANSGGDISSDGGSAITARGVCWSVSPNPTTANDKTTDGTAIGNYSSSITGLLANTKYYLRAYATNAIGTTYGEQFSFTTNYQLALSAINKTYADDLFSLNNPTTNSLGLFTYTSSDPSVASISGNTVTILAAGTTTVTLNQAAYENYASQEVTATLTVAKAQQTISLSIPTSAPLNTFTGTSIAINASSSVGLPVTVSKSGDAIATLDGTPGNYVLSNISSTGTVTITADQAGNNNYLSASVSMSFDVTLGNQTISFGAINAVTYPIVTSIDLSTAASTNASGGLAINYSIVSGPATISANTLTITGPGIVKLKASQSGNASWNPAPDVYQNLTVNLATPTITNFTPVTGSPLTAITITGTNFYNTSSVRFGGTLASSFTVNSSTEIIAYVAAGSNGDVSVTTPAGTATLNGFSWLSNDASLSALTVSSSSLIPVFNSSTLNYTINVANGISSFVVTPTVNQSNATIKVNGTTNASAFASSSISLNVGNNTISIIVTAQDGSTSKTYTLSVNRAANLATLTTVQPTNISYNTASTGAEISSDGSASITARGVCWSTSQNPTTNDSKTIDGIGTGNFTSTISGLNSNTTYYVRAYATNSAGTSYGLQMSFTTNSQLSFADLNKTYGDASFLINNPVSSSLGAFSYSCTDASIATINNKTVTINAAGSTTITVTQAANGAFASQSATATLTVNKATQILTLSVPQTAALNTFIGTSAPVSASSTSNLPVIISINSASTATATLNLVDGNYSITNVSSTGTIIIDADQAGDGNNYSAKISQSFDVTKGNQTIVFGALSAVTYPTITTVDLSSAATTNSGLSIVYTVVSGPATISGSTLTLSGNANVRIKASQDGNASWNAAPNVYQNLTVNQPAPTISSFTPTAGNALTNVTITGTNFINVSEVKFGSTAANNFTVNSATEIIANVALGSSGTVSVITLGGTATKDGFIFYGVPTITSFTPTSGGTNATITITGTSLATVSSISFGGTAAASFTPVSETSITAVVGNGTSGSVSLTTLGGTVSLAGFTWLKNDATLSSLSISAGSLSPSYLPSTISYTTSVANIVTGITVTPTVNEAHASVSVNGTAVLSAAASQNIALTVGDNTITIVVTAQDGSTKTYTIVVTRAATTATISTEVISAITSSSANSGGNISDDGGASVTAKGVCWSTSTNPTIADNKTNDGSGIGTFSSSLTSLTANTTYYVRAYATNSIGTVYGTERSFTSNQQLSLADINKTFGDAAFDLVNPVSNSTGAFSYTSSNASVATVVGNTITIVGGGTSTITATQAADVSNATQSTTALLTVGKNNQTISFPALSAVTYSNGMTIDLTGKATTTATGLSIGYSVVSGAGSITNNILTITNSGTIRIKASQIGNSNWNPATDQYQDLVINQLAPVISSFSPVASASGGTVTILGANFDNVSSISLGGIAVSSYTVTGSTSISAVVGAGASGDVSVTTPGGTITKSGFSWLSSDATLSALGISTSTLSPSFAAATITYTTSVANSVTGIIITPTVTEANATIKVNGTSVVSAAASQNIALAVGDNSITVVVTAQDGTTTKTYTITLTRAANFATLTSTDVSSISPTSASAGGNISSDGEATVTARGVCWSTTTNPTIADSKTTDGTGTGTFNASISGLSANTIYYVRAYATNSIGTAYGQEVSFTTNKTLSLSDINKTFGDPAFVIQNPASNSVGSFNYSSGTPATATISGNTVSIVAAGTSTITVTQAANGAFASQTTTAFLTVGKADQYITLGVPTTAALNTFTSTSVSVSANSTSGLVVGITKDAASTATADLVNTSGAYSLTNVASTGTIIINATQAGNSNYNPTSVSRSFDVTIGNQIIEFPQLTAVSFAAGLTVDLTGKATTNATGLTIIYSVVSGPATISGNVLIITSEGTIKIKASQAGDANWNAAADTYQDLVVNQSAPTISSFTPTSGRTLASISITGTNLHNASAVKFGAVSSNSFTVNSATSITAIVGAGATGDISVTTPGGTATKSGFSYISSDATLSDINLSNGTLSPTYTASTTSYTASVAYAVTNITVTPTVNETNASVKVNGTTVTSGTASQSINLNVGSNTITILVTAQDGTTTKTYTITVTRSATTATVSITTISAIDKTTASAGADISIDGGSAVTARGVCWSTTTNPTIADNKTSNGTGTGTFSSSITGLTANTTYYVRAYATNGIGTVYGTEVIFTTNKQLVLADLNKIYGDAAFDIVNPSSNAAGSFTYTSSNTSVATIAGNTVTIVGVGASTITATQASNGNYVSQSTTTLLTVGKSAQTISFASLASKTYGDIDFAPAATATSGLVVAYSSSNSNVATIVANQIHIVGAGTTDITASQSGNGYFNAAVTKIQILTVLPKSLTVSGAIAQNKVYDGNDTATITGGTLIGIINSDDVSFIASGSFASVNVANGLVVTSTSTLGGAKLNNYTLIQPTGLSANITKASQTISFGALSSKTIGDPDYNPGATASSALAISYTSSDQNVATIINGKIHILSVGTTTITASQAGNTTYEAAADVAQVLHVLNLPPSNLRYATPVVYTQNIAITSLKPAVVGSVTSYTISPSLPSGLLFNATTGTISGTPTSASVNTDYLVTAINNNGTSNFTVNITVNAANAPISGIAPSNLSYAAPVVYTQNTLISNLKPSVIGTVVSYSVSPALPAGLTLNTTTGIISGTPSSATAASDYLVIASNNYGSTSYTLNITVNALNAPITGVAPSNLSYAAPVVYTQNILISNLKPSVNGTVDVYAITPSLPAGLVLNTTTGIISGTPSSATAASDYLVTATNTHGSTSYTLNITVNAVAATRVAPSNLSYSTPVVYTQNQSIAVLKPTYNGNVVRFSVSPTLPTGLVLNDSTGNISGIPVSASVKTDYTITAFNTYGNTNFVVNITVNALNATGVAPSNLNYATPVIYKQNEVINNLIPTVIGSVDFYSITPNLPSGLSMSATTGIISGTPTVSATANSYVITASNNYGATNFTLNITINAQNATAVAPSNLSYTTPSVFKQNFVINNLIPTVNGTVSYYTITPSLPIGLIFNGSTGIISGSPTSPSVATDYLVTATNAYGSTNCYLNIAVSASTATGIAPSSLSYATPVVFTQNTLINNLKPTVTGVIDSFKVASSLPLGLTINPITGIISGTPTVASVAKDYQIIASNNYGSTSFNINITVNAVSATGVAPSNLSYSTPVVYTQNVAINNLKPIVNGDVVRYSVSKTLPAGLIFDTATGIIRGIPTVASISSNYLVTAINNYGSTSFVLNITVNAADAPITGIAPSNLSYATPVVYTQNTLISNLKPTFTGTIDSYTIAPGLPAGLSFNATSGIISGTPSIASSATDYLVTATNANGSTSFTLNITVNAANAPIAGIAPSNLSYAAPVVYTQNSLISNLKPSVIGTVVSYSVSPALPAGLTLNTTTGIISGTPSSATAASDYLVTATNTYGSTSYTLNITVNAANAPITGVAPSNLSYAAPVVYTQNTLISNLKPSVSGTVISYNVSSALPSGLVLNTTTGIISGTPSSATAASDYLVTATNTYGSTSYTLNITVNAVAATGVAPSNLSYAAPVVYTQNTLISNLKPIVIGTVVSYSVSPNLPAGLTLNTTTGIISGTPSWSSKAADYLITASNAYGSTSYTLNITVNAATATGVAPSNLSYTSPLVFTQFAPITAISPIVIGTVDNYTISPWLPTGLQINKTTGIITGTATVPSISTDYLITANNSYGSTSFIVNITVNAAPLITVPVITTTGATTFCEGGTVLLTSTAAQQYQWYKNDVAIVTNGNNQTFTANATGTYNVETIGVNPLDKALSNTISVIVNPLPIVAATASSNSVSRGKSVVLSATGLGSFAWTPIDNINFPYSKSTEARVLAKTNYTVTLTDMNGCKNTAVVAVDAVDDLYVEPAIVFTPNGDGINDRFVIKNLDQYPVNRLQIFDRLGKKVYEKENYNNDWRGTIGNILITKDTYYYILSVNGQIVKKGAITVAR